MKKVSDELRTRLEKIQQAISEMSKEGNPKKELLKFFSKVEETKKTMTTELWAEFREYITSLKHDAAELNRKIKVASDLCPHDGDPDDDNCYLCGRCQTPHWAE